MGKITAHLKNILDVTTFYTGNMFLCHKINIQWRGGTYGGNAPSINRFSCTQDCGFPIGIDRRDYPTWNESSQIYAS